MTSSSRLGPSRWLRRRWALDRAVAALALVLGSPLIAVLGTLVRRTSPGGAFVGLPRVGVDGQQFTMWKLRSMRAADASGAAGGSVLTLGNDDRITPVGHLMRRLRLDELPQLLNVIRGEMALIGPRPETPSYVDDRDPAWQAVLAARPAIAGPTQVLVHEWEATLEDAELYRREVLPVKLAIDRWYVEHASLAVDGLVVVALAESLLGRRSTTVLHRRVLRDVPEAATIPGDRVRRGVPGARSA